MRIMEQFFSVFDNVQAPETLRTRFNIVYESYQWHDSLFSYYQSIFRVLLKFDYNDSVPTGQPSPLLEPFRYGWVFLLYCQSILFHFEIMLTY